ncbi:tRNA (guanosine(37)-N1)-methyltransferase TrmD, partial [Escherichia coli]
PEVLMNGNHKLIEQWQLKESLRRTFQRRPDMLENYPWTEEMQKLLKESEEEAKAGN